MTHDQEQTEFINDRDIMFAVASNIISITVLFLPRYIAEKTVAADGWVTIVLGGLVAIMLGWLLAKIASLFPNQSFLSFASYLVSKPMAILLCLLFIGQYMSISAFQMREIATLSHEYLFDRTPLAVVCLAFLLVVIYAVSGSRAAIFRLNILFFPFVIGGLILLIIFPLGAMKLENLLPMFETDLKGIVHGTTASINAFLGVSIVLFYTSLVKEPRQTAKMTVLGILWPFFFYLVIFIVCIGVFGNVTTNNLYYPVFELSKTVSNPENFIERFDSILFIIWTLIVFTTSLMAFDVAVLLLNLLFHKMNKQTIIFLLSPVIFFLAMLPKSYFELNEIAKYMAYIEIAFLLFVIIILGVMLLIKGVKTND